MNNSSTSGEPGPEIDDSQNPTSAAPGDEARAPFRDMLTQLQSMIDTVAYRSGPVLREVAAKAAELAAVAGEKAGPIAQKAAEKTAEFGAVVAARGHEMATDLRRADDADQASASSDAPSGTAGPSENSGADEADGA